jgi:hypothetical protein
MELLTILQNFSPIATVALALFIIYQLIQRKTEVSEIKENHLHGLPEMNETLKRLETKSDKTVELLTKIETKLK